MAEIRGWETSCAGPHRKEEDLYIMILLSFSGLSFKQGDTNHAWLECDASTLTFR